MRTLAKFMIDLSFIRRVMKVEEIIRTCQCFMQAVKSQDRNLDSFQHEKELASIGTR